jgi:5'-methylthioadenosine phosphorylase
MAKRTVGIIGGSGLYEMEGLKNVEEVRVETPYGEPSDALVVGMLGDAKLAFLPRHGRGHRVLPSEINYRANIYALRKLGCEIVLSVSAVGSMREHIAPGDVVIVDQFIDLTKKRASTFFGEGCVGHVSFSHPIDADVAGVLAAAAEATGRVKVHRGGTYVCIEGPQFSTLAESRLYRSWGVDVIGMTNMPEAKLAREAEMRYATMALPTDYDCWHETEAPVSVEAVIAILMKNVENAKAILKATIERLVEDPRELGRLTALQHAVMTDGAKVPAETRAKLGLFLERYGR